MSPPPPSLFLLQAEWQGQGVGTSLLAQSESLAAARGARLLLIDTGGGDDFKAARRFYERAGFAAEATIADYWGKGEAKITFTKRFA